MLLSFIECFVLNSSVIILTFIYLGEDFIAPCKCKGSSKYVHRECLDQWRAVKVCIQIVANLEFIRHASIL